MDDPLRGPINIYFLTDLFVLILVVMDDPLREGKIQMSRYTGPES